MKQIIQWFRRPYPVIDTFPEQCALSLFLGAVVSLILFIFQPFGIADIPSIKLLCIGGFGMITTISVTVLLLIVSFVPIFGYREQKWSVWRQTLFILTLLLMISYGNLALNNSISEICPSEPYSFPEFFSITILVGTVPLFAAVFFSERLNRNKNGKTAEEMNRELIHESVHSASLPVSPVDFICARAEGNYIQIFSFTREPQLVRMTMKELENLYSDEPAILRCHRSCMVNIAAAVSVEGNAGGLILEMKKGEPVPVSRSYVPLVKKSIGARPKS